jgi:nitroimidazol reductase NimA-like FMN-containing flavoprotein (pyridoxamine 5'-phosphate oxidase superfamily)
VGDVREGQGAESWSGARTDELGVDECWARLATTSVGRLCFVEGEDPVVLPFNYAVDGHSVVMRTGSWTALERVAAAGATVAFEADVTWPRLHEGWSVVVRGLLTEVTDEGERAALARIPLHPWAGGQREHFVRIQPWSVTGREVRSPRGSDRSGSDPTGGARAGGLELLSREECLDLLVGTGIGRIGFELDGVPHVLPMNCAVDDDGTVVFRTDAASVLAQLAGRPAIFEIDGFDERTRTGWSVCVRGRGRDLGGATDRLARHLLDLSVITWASGPRDCWFAITAEDVTGRRIPLVHDASYGWIPGVVS